MLTRLSESRAGSGYQPPATLNPAPNARRGQQLELAGLLDVQPPPVAQAVDRVVAGDPEQPGAERLRAPLVLGKGLENAQEHVLGGILRLVGGAQREAHVAPHPSEVPR